MRTNGSAIFVSSSGRRLGRHGLDYLLKPYADALKGLTFLSDVSFLKYEFCFLFIVHWVQDDVFAHFRVDFLLLIDSPVSELLADLCA